MGHPGSISPPCSQALAPLPGLVPVKLLMEPIPVSLQGVCWETGVQLEHELHRVVVQVAAVLDDLDEWC